MLLGGYIPAVNQVFPGVITATGGVTGAFSSVANSTPILGWQVIDPTGTVDLLSKRNYAGAGLDLTRNQFNVGAMLNGIQGAATGDLAYVLNTIAALPSNSAVANAFQQISPEKAAALSTLAFAGANSAKEHPVPADHRPALRPRRHRPGPPGGSAPSISTTPRGQA